jgi:hypothetical protein
MTFGVLTGDHCWCTNAGSGGAALDVKEIRDSAWWESSHL